MGDKLRFLWNRIRERLWVRPLAFCVLSLTGVFLARLADRAALEELVPEINPQSLNTLLSILSSSMLVIATFAVASMISAYASAASTATPRSFALVVSDDVSQNALSTFIGAFIYSIVALVFLENSYYGKAGNFALFVLTLAVFALVVVTFVRWVDRIARLGRLRMIIEKVEKATAAALERRRRAPSLGGSPARDAGDSGRPVYAPEIGYVQRVDIERLQEHAGASGTRILVRSPPGAFAAPGTPLAEVLGEGGEEDSVARAFTIGNNRVFDDDPRFGLVTLSEIAARALSPAVNDPGTAIDILGTLVRLFALWAAPLEDGSQEQAHDRVLVPPLDAGDLFDDAFTAIARDGAGSLEVAIRLQKTLGSLAAIGDAELRAAAERHARLAFARAAKALVLEEDLERLRRSAPLLGAA